MWISTHLGAMTDGSKRLRDQDDFPRHPNMSRCLESAGVVPVKVLS